MKLTAICVLFAYTARINGSWFEDIFQSESGQKPIDQVENKLFGSSNNNPKFTYLSEPSNGANDEKSPQNKDDSNPSNLESSPSKYQALIPPVSLKSDNNLPLNYAPPLQPTIVNQPPSSGNSTPSTGDTQSNYNPPNNSFNDKINSFIPLGTNSNNVGRKMNYVPPTQDGQQLSNPVSNGRSSTNRGDLSNWETSTTENSGKIPLNQSPQSSGQVSQPSSKTDSNKFEQFLNSIFSPNKNQTATNGQSQGNSTNTSRATNQGSNTQRSGFGGFLDRLLNKTSNSANSTSLNNTQSNGSSNDKNIIFTPKQSQNTPNQNSTQTNVGNSTPAPTKKPSFLSRVWNGIKSIANRVKQAFQKGKQKVQELKNK